MIARTDVSTTVGPVAASGQEPISHQDSNRVQELHRGTAGVYVYAGNCATNSWQYRHGYVGLAISPVSDRDILHDMRNPLPYDDDTIDRFQSEDVFEHIAFQCIPDIIDDIYRTLKTGGLFRLSIPDYRCDVLRRRCLYSNAGEIVFDPGGGGTIDATLTVRDGGHLWFPRYETVAVLFNNTRFRRENIRFLQYYDEHGVGHLDPIDYSLGFVKRTPDHDDRVRSPARPMSIVVDAYK